MSTYNLEKFEEHNISTHVSWPMCSKAYRARPQVHTRLTSLPDSWPMCSELYMTRYAPLTSTSVSQSWPMCSKLYRARYAPLTSTPVSQSWPMCSKLYRTRYAPQTSTPEPQSWPMCSKLYRARYAPQTSTPAPQSWPMCSTFYMARCAPDSLVENSNNSPVMTSNDSYSAINGMNNSTTIPSSVDSHHVPPHAADTDTVTILVDLLSCSSTLNPNAPWFIPNFNPYTRGVGRIKQGDGPELYF